MKDVHMHLENGAYTYEWLMEFVRVAQQKGVEEIWVVEHTHRFYEFNPMYHGMSAVSEKQAAWLRKKKQIPLSSYINFIRAMRKCTFPIKIRFGLEVCFFPDKIDFIKQQLTLFKFVLSRGFVQFCKKIKTRPLRPCLAMIGNNKTSNYGAARIISVFHFIQNTLN